MRSRTLRACVGGDVDGGDLLPGLSSACGVGVEGRFDGAVLCSQHSISRRVFNLDDKVGVLGRIILLGVGEDVGTIRGGTEEDGGVIVVLGLRSGRRWMLVWLVVVPSPSIL